MQKKTREDSRECERLKELLSHRTNEYIEEVLAPYFGGVISFVREIEPLAQASSVALKNYESERSVFAGGREGGSSASAPGARVGWVEEEREA